MHSLLRSFAHQAHESFAAGEREALNRRVRAQQSLAVSPPQQHEVSHVHWLYQESEQELLRQKQQLQTAATTLLREDMLIQGTKGLNEATGKKAKNYRWMASTVFKNAQLMHLQVFLFLRWASCRIVTSPPVYRGRLGCPCYLEEVYLLSSCVIV